MEVVAILSYFEAGGAIMWILAALSVAAVTVAAERLIFFWRASTNPGRLEAYFANAMNGKRPGDAEKIVSASRSSLHRIFKTALDHWDIGCEEMAALMGQEIRREVFRWEKHLMFLEITARAAPLLGLLGTVLGMVEMFSALHAGGQVTASAVTGGIWKALYTTVAGLSVAIPALFVHALLTGRIDSQEECLRRGADFLTRMRFRAADGDGGP